MKITQIFSLNINKKTIQRAKIAIVISEFNKTYTLSLLNKCQETLLDHGIQESSLSIFWVPGAFEIPLACQKLAETKKYDVIIALGAVIKGDTYHFEMVCQECTRGIMKVMLKTGIPIVFEVLMAEKEKHIKKRASNDKHNKGIGAAECALKILHNEVMMKK